jgi:hypothetical protein
LNSQLLISNLLLLGGSLSFVVSFILLRNYSISLQKEEIEKYAKSAGPQWISLTYLGLMVSLFATESLLTRIVLGCIVITSSVVWTIWHSKQLVELEINSEFKSKVNSLPYTALWVFSFLSIVSSAIVEKI